MTDRKILLKSESIAIFKEELGANPPGDPIRELWMLFHSRQFARVAEVNGWPQEVIKKILHNALLTDLNTLCKDLLEYIT